MKKSSSLTTSLEQPPEKHYIPPGVIWVPDFVPKIKAYAAVHVSISENSPNIEFIRTYPDFSITYYHIWRIAEVK